MCRRNGRDERRDRACGRSHKTVDAGDVVVRRLAEMRRIGEHRDDEQERKSNEGDDGDGGQSGFHF